MNTITQTTPKVQTFDVYEYSFALINPVDGDIQTGLTAAFKQAPTSQDWLEFLSGWIDCGYRFYSVPRLINII